MKKSIDLKLQKNILKHIILYIHIVDLLIIWSPTQLTFPFYDFLYNLLWFIIILLNGPTSRSSLCPPSPSATAPLASSVTATTTGSSLSRRVGSSSSSSHCHLHHHATSPPPPPLVAASSPSSNLRERERGWVECHHSPRPQVAPGQFPRSLLGKNRVGLPQLVGLIHFSCFVFLKWFLFHSLEESLMISEMFLCDCNFTFSGSDFKSSIVNQNLKA
jgi:hypothetical protein